MTVSIENRLDSEVTLFEAPRGKSVIEPRLFPGQRLDIPAGITCYFVRVPNRSSEEEDKSLEVRYEVSIAEGMDMGLTGYRVESFAIGGRINGEMLYDEKQTEDAGVSFRGTC